MSFLPRVQHFSYCIYFVCAGITFIFRGENPHVSGRHVQYRRSSVTSILKTERRKNRTFCIRMCKTEKLPYRYPCGDAEQSVYCLFPCSHTFSPLSGARLHTKVCYESSFGTLYTIFGKQQIPFDRLIFPNLMRTRLFSETALNKTAHFFILCVL